MTPAEFNASVDRDVRALIERHSPPVIRECCWSCGGFRVVPIRIPGAAVWPTSMCCVCRGKGYVCVEVL